MIRSYDAGYKKGSDYSTTDKLSKYQDTKIMFKLGRKNQATKEKAQESS